MKTLKVMIAVLIAQGLVFASQNVNAATVVVYNDNFENISPGGTPTPTVGTNFGTDNGLVIAAGAGTNSTTATHPGSPSGGSNIYYADRPDGESMGHFGGFSQDASTGDTVRAEMDMLVVSNAGGAGGMLFGLGSDGLGLAADGGYMSILFLANGDGSIDYRTATGWSTTSGTYTTDAWNHIVIDYAIGSSTATLTIGAGTPIAVTAPFAGAAGPASTTPPFDVDSVFIRTANGNAIGYVDNIIATVTSPIPEPASMAMLGLAAMCMLGRRR